MKFKTAIAALLILAVSISSCKKIRYETESSDDAILSKITIWDTKTDKELLFYEVVYNSKGGVQSAKGADGDVYSTVYNDATGQLVKVTKNSVNGDQAVYIHTYDASGRIIKNSITETIVAGAEVHRYDYTFVYNAAGKVSQIILEYLGYTTVTDYTWTGDNMTEAKINDPLVGVTTVSYKYDNKLSPGLLGGQFLAVVMYGVPSSKNNPIETTTTIFGISNTQKYTYTYNSANYATSQKIVGSDLGLKVYYAKK